MNATETLAAAGFEQDTSDSRIWRCHASDVVITAMDYASRMHIEQKTDIGVVVEKNAGEPAAMAAAAAKWAELNR